MSVIIPIKPLIPSSDKYSLDIRAAIAGIGERSVNPIVLTSILTQIQDSSNRIEKAIRINTSNTFQEILVKDASGAVIGWIGTRGGYSGAWFKQLYVGADGPDTAPFFADVGGNVIIGKNGSLALQDGGGNEVGWLGVQTDSAKAITGATNATPIEISVTAHGYEDGDTVLIEGVLGNTAANGYRIVKNVTAGTFEITTLAGVDVAGNGAYGGAGTSTRYFGGGRFQTLAIGNSFTDYKLRAYADGQVHIKDALITLTDAVNNGYIEFNPSTGPSAIFQNTSTGGQVSIFSGNIFLTNYITPAELLTISAGQITLTSSVSNTSFQVSNTAGFGVVSVCDATGLPTIGMLGSTGTISATVGSFVALSASGGVVTLLPGAAPSIGDVWTATSTGGVGGWAPASGGGSLPVVDTTAIVKGSADATKLLRFEVDGFTTGTTRVMTPPDADITVAGINIAQTWTASQTFQNVLFSADNTYNIGSTGTRPGLIYAHNFDGAPIGTTGNYVKTRKVDVADVNGDAYFWDIQATASALGTASDFFIRDNSGSRWLRAVRVSLSTPVNYTDVFSDWRPAKRSTGSGDSVTDLDFPSLGGSGAEWKKAWVTDLYVSGGTSNITTTGNVSVGSLDITGAGFSFSIGGTTIINSSLVMGSIASYLGDWIPNATGGPYSLGDAGHPWDASLGAVGISGTITIPTSAGAGKVLTSDASGVATWQTPAASQWITIGSDIYYSAGKVGINTSSPSEKLEVAGVIRTTGRLQITGNTVPASRGGIEFSYDSTGDGGSGWGGMELYAPGTTSPRAATWVAKDHRFYATSSVLEAWRINSSGHFIAPTDNTYDIGASGATRPRNGYFAGTITSDSVNITGNGILSVFTIDGTGIITGQRKMSGIVDYLGNWLPSSNNTYTIGDASKRWIGYFSSINASSLVTASAGLSTTNITMSGTFGSSNITTTGGMTAQTYDATGALGFLIGGSSVITSAKYGFLNNLDIASALNVTGAVTGGSYKVGATTVIDSSRNITNAGTGSFSGAITAVGGLTSTAAGIGGTGFNVYSGGWYFGQTQTSMQIVTDMRDNSGTIEKKTRSLDIRGGVVTSIGAESAWTAI